MKLNGVTGTHKNLSPFLFLGLLLFAVSPLGWTQQSAVNSSKPLVRHGQTPEDWSSISLAGSKLNADPPFVGEKGEFPTFTRELLQVKWRTGDPIDLYVIRPKNVTKPPVVLYLYSYPSETDRFRDNEYCARITEGGYAAVGFVSALTGQRYHMRPMKEWFVSELQESLGSSVHDVQMILNYLSTRGDLDMNRVGMFGTGSGATIAILAAAADPRIKAIDLLDPWGDWPDWMAKSSIIPEDERPNYVKPEFLKKVAPLDPVQWLPQLKTQDIRIQRLKNDTTTPQVAAEKIEAAAGSNVKIVRYDDVKQFYGTGSGGRVFQWVKDQLRPARETNSAGNNISQSTATPSSHGHVD
ncbi:MAG TPA: CocE/NonD family hydrolase [Terriglobales bacterium]|nr:CocE/NonD family hydrolase [Terriglobales bacterium]